VRRPRQPFQGICSFLRTFILRSALLNSFCSRQLDGERGSWLYRGYLVGNANGRLVGRWRETASPVDYPGYEGCFVMRRRH
jgi:hypothetical protein